MRVLVVVDMQNDFIDGVLGTSEAMRIVSSVKSKIDGYLNSGDQVIFTQDTHSENYLDTQEGKNLPVKHCIKGTPGWDISLKLNTVGCTIIEKNTFGSIALSEFLSELDSVQSIELVGLCTDICVISNAMIIKAKMPEVPISVDASCCAGVTNESHRIALAAMSACQIDIIGDN